MKVLVALALLTATAYAGDPAAGKAKSLACQACHFGADAIGPHLVGQREKYLATQLTAFKSGDRKNDLMSAIAKQLSDPDIADLAAYWSAQSSGSDASVSDAVAAITKSRMPFPKDFPKGFTVYNTVNDAAQHTSSKSYVNAIALAAAKAGKPLPSGSVIIVATTDDKNTTAYSAMEARAGWGKDVPPLLQNGDWNYNLWTADRKPKEFNQAFCLACHKPAAASSFVFTFDKIKASR